MGKSTFWSNRRCLKKYHIYLIAVRRRWSKYIYKSQIFKYLRVFMFGVLLCRKLSSVDQILIPQNFRDPGRFLEPGRLRSPSPGLLPSGPAIDTFQFCAWAVTISIGKASGPNHTLHYFIFVAGSYHLRIKSSHSNRSHAKRTGSNPNSNCAVCNNIPAHQQFPKIFVDPLVSRRKRTHTMALPVNRTNPWPPESSVLGVRRVHLIFILQAFAKVESDVYCDFKKWWYWFARVLFGREFQDPWRFLGPKVGCVRRS